MTPLGLVGAGPQSLEPGTSTLPPWKLQFHDALGLADRLWVRGRLVGFTSSVSDNQRSSIWRIPGRRPAELIKAPTALLETRVSGKLLTSTVELRTDGSFDAIFEAPLPPAKRGWRIARNRVTFRGQSAENCAVVLAPPIEAKTAVVVVLPVAECFARDGIQRILRVQNTLPVPKLLREHEDRLGKTAVYYLATAPPLEETRQAELALTMTTSRWPTGHLLVLPADRSQAHEALVSGLTRLRWVLAHHLPVAVVVCDMALVDSLDRLPAAPDLAPIDILFPSNQNTLTAESRGVHPRPVRDPEWAGSRGALVPRHPVVFCHGMLAFTTLRGQIREDWNCFLPLRDFLHQHGIRALFPQVLPTGGVEARAKQLKDQILHFTNEPVHIVAHSMGGLDARYLISHLGMAEQVASLTTIATPHQGSYLVDWFLENFRQRVPLLLALEAMGFNVDGFRDCRPSACTGFNKKTPDAPGVRYFSYGGAVPFVRVTPALRRAWNLLSAVEGPNDGMVSVSSARWGEYLGTLHADHFAQTPDMTFVHPNESFDPLGFYSRLVQDLARRGL